MIKVPIAVVNASTRIDDSSLRAAVDALRVQVDRDFAPAWNAGADLTVITSGNPAPADSWWIIVLDNSDLGTALGYHDLTSAGLPMGKVFVETALAFGENWTNLLSHEVLEMLSDPYINLTALAPTTYGLFLYTYENCDACQSTDQGYDIDGQTMSNFCLPAWFDWTRYNGAGPFDFLGRMRQPFELLPGGYAMRRNLSTLEGWTIVSASGQPLEYTARPRVGSRRERRKTQCTNWIRSKLEAGRKP